MVDGKGLVTDSAINRVHHGNRRRSEMANAKRVAVFVERDGLDIDTRERHVDAPRVPSAVVSRIAEGVVVIDLGQRSVEAAIAVDVSGDTVIVGEDERYGKRQDASPAPRTEHRLEERAREPTRFGDVGEKRIAETTKPEERIEDIGIRTRVRPLDDVELLQALLRLPGRERAVDRV